jgi:hypothetical protein
MDIKAAAGFVGLSLSLSLSFPLVGYVIYLIRH